MTTKTTKTTSKPAPVNPEQAQQEADRLAGLAHEAAAQARAAHADLSDAMEQAERRYWQEQVTEFYATTRKLWDQQWEVIRAAVLSGDGAKVVSEWITWRRVRGRVHAAHGVLKHKAEEYGITGVRPTLPDGRTRHRFAEALDTFCDAVEEQANRETRAALSDGAAQVREAAEQSRRDGHAVVSTPDLEPVAVFLAPEQYPELTVNLDPDLSVKFHEGQLAVHDGLIAERLRLVADDLDITEITPRAPSVA